MHILTTAAKNSVGEGVISFKITESILSRQETLSIGLMVRECVGASYLGSIHRTY